MNQKSKTILGAAVMIGIIAASALLYQNLGKIYTPPSQANASDEKKPQADSSDAKKSPTDDSDASEKIIAPDFSVVDSDGNTVKLSDFAGKPVVINFWASWCPPCKKEMPDFEAVWKEMGEDVVFMMVNATDGSRETEEKAKKHIADNEFTFPVYYDTEQQAAAAYGISSLPTTFFIDKDGYLVTGSIGMMSESALRKNIDLILPADAENTLKDPS